MPDGQPARGVHETHTTQWLPLVVTVALMLAFAASRLAIASVASEREYDEGVYLLSARALLAGHEMFSTVFSSQPPAFLESLVLAMRVGGDSIETARLMVLGFALVAMAAVASLAARIAGPWAGPAAAAALALSGTFGDLAHVVEAELPALAVGLLSVVAAFEARRRDWNRGWLLASGALLGLGSLFKLIVLPLAAPLGLVLLLAPVHGDETRWELDGRGTGLLARVAGRSALVAAGALAVVLLPLLFYERHALFEQTVSFHADKHEAYRHSPFGNLQRAARDVLQDDAVSATAVAGLVLLALGRRLAFAWLAVWAGAMLAVITMQAPLFWRHLVLLSLPIALAAGVAAPLAAARLRSPAPMLVTLAVISVWMVVMLPRQDRRHDSMFPLLADPRRERHAGSYLTMTSRWLEKHTEPHELVAGDDPIAVYMAGRQAPPALCDTSAARIASGSLTLEEATRESASARVIVLRHNGRLSRLHGYTRWLGEHYEKQPPLGTGIDERRSIWVRKDRRGRPHS